MNSTTLKNELIFSYSSGTLGEAKSLFTAMYLYLNSVASKKASIFDNILASNLNDVESVTPKKLNYTDCINQNNSETNNSSNPTKSSNPLLSIFDNLEDLNWKTAFKGFKEYSLPVNDNDSLKIIKMEPGTSVPLHSHNGKEFILVIDGSFKDEYGEYSKGDMQVNDQQIKHNPTACETNGCICLTITENDVVFFGKYGSALNLFTFIKSFFK